MKTYQSSNVILNMLKIVHLNCHMQTKYFIDSVDEDNTKNIHVYTLYAIDPMMQIFSIHKNKAHQITRNIENHMYA